MLLTAKGDVMIVERSARAPTAHEVICSCRKFEKQSLYNVTSFVVVVAAAAVAVAVVVVVVVVSAIVVVIIIKY
jgi:hypothetical protein